MDAPEQSRELVERLRLPFRSLCDVSREVVRRYELLHAGGGPEGTDIAVPALLLVRPDGTIAWRHVANAAQDRADPADVLAAVRAL